MSEPVIETILLSLLFLGIITFTYIMIKSDGDDQ
jgi:hypothetical protein